MGASPIGDQTLHIKYSLHPVGISHKDSVVVDKRYTAVLEHYSVPHLVGVNVPSSTEGCKRMFCLNPFDAPLPLRTFDLGFAKPKGLHRDLQTIAPNFSTVIIRRDIDGKKVLAGHFP